jgi:hypothetical protein
LHDGESPDPHKLVNSSTASNKSAGAHARMPAEHGTLRNDDIGFHRAVVSHVTGGHDEAAFAHAGFPARLCASVHGAVFTQNRTVSNVRGGMYGSVEMQILRVPADHCAWSHNNVPPQSRVA